MKLIKYDYITNQIRNMVKLLLRTIFRKKVELDSKRHVELKTASGDLLDTEEERALLERLLDLSDRGEIDRAENELFSVEDSETLSTLKVGLLFYYYLNEMEDSFLFKNDFSREEIELGLKDLVADYGLEDLVRIY